MRGTGAGKSWPDPVNPEKEDGLKPGDPVHDTVTPGGHHLVYRAP